MRVCYILSNFLNSNGSLILLTYISFTKLLCMSIPLVRCWLCNHDSIVWNYLIVIPIAVVAMFSDSATQNTLDDPSSKE